MLFVVTGDYQSYACIADEKPFHCDVPRCSQSFKTSYNLRDHKRLKHYHMLRYQCSKCHKYVCLSVSPSVCHTGLLIFIHMVTWLHGSGLAVVIWRPVGCGYTDGDDPQQRVVFLAQSLRKPELDAEALQRVHARRRRREDGGRAAQPQLDTCGGALSATRSHAAWAARR